MNIKCYGTKPIAIKPAYICSPYHNSKGKLFLVQVHGAYVALCLHPPVVSPGSSAGEFIDVTLAHKLRRHYITHTEKSRIRETKHLSTEADSSTYAIGG